MLLKKAIFDIKDLLYKHENDEYYLSYALLKMQDKIKECKYQGTYFNLGEKTGYLKAGLHYAMKNTKEKEELTEYVKKIM